MLSPLELTCLRWVAQGKAAAQIAQIEGKSINEIEGYFERAVRSLGATSIEAAVEKANLKKSD
ncbi:DNA-binding CsgD family transcriptional regulator [Rhizobium sp. BK077]|uniref:LuxR C-terminal-related transcriptional regulator n=1 Tax=unclassified Rhizobium TaxID=2613769 RepID=UPI0017CC86BA|nr:MULTISPECIES: LuxR C-terminal-related transcriptional regulator [unclassified Rhizobium]MBB3302250.1 DNA-binding CsgD family transcriptional regulator [Rhizobium sp. BK112]MBB3371372.1 DNA-binding CsgD family transcriptional regulator [Rhizobium sp. BK077]MBB4182139.1 DNA-binding CsgD family transcriptional regulator [Rhizobium sp. BK109]MBB4255569.1 DNA-binding CsgD family transcriptional regulator [Rhizobium sp. BK008]